MVPAQKKEKKLQYNYNRRVPTKRKTFPKRKFSSVFRDSFLAGFNFDFFFFKLQSNFINSF